MCTCEQTFMLRSDFMIHRKKGHIESVPKCKEEIENCQFGAIKCWFRHIEHEYETAKYDTTNRNEKSQDILEKIFDMVEKSPERVIHLENKTKI